LVVIVPSEVSTSRRLQFGSFEADLHSGELRKNGRRVRLQAQPFQLLAMLLERPGELVTREEICQKLWSGDTFVDFDQSLGTAISKIREVLNDSATEPRFVETLPRRGYRFIATVTPVAETAQEVMPSPSLEAGAEEENHRKASSHGVIWAGASVILLVTALVAWYAVPRPHPIRSIAVLPLVSLSIDQSQQFFAYGVTDELTTNLAQISSIQVSSHTSSTACSGMQKPASQVARCLGVDALVEGSVVRFGDRVRLTVQLIDAASDRHLWARTYDLQLSDILTVQGELARGIAASISHTLTPQEEARLSRPRPMNPEVALLYFKASNLLSKPDASQARDLFKQAIQLAPNSAESWAGLADAYHTIGVFSDDNDAFDQAKVAANRALEIDPSQAQALMVLGVTSFLYDWNPEKSETYFRQSLASRPSYAMAHAIFATILARRGRVEEAIQEIGLAGMLDPISVPVNSFAWHVYFCARRYDDALRVILAVNQMDPTFGPAYGRLAMSWEQRGEYGKAIDASAREQMIEGESPEKVNREAAQLRTALASGGPRAYWQKRFDNVPAGNRHGQAIALFYMHLGRREDALTALEESYRLRDHYLIFWITTQPEFDPLRSEPRFQKLLHDLRIS
jgi:TolB-like protein/DNA-binding winged helix-turn-helix (wHTH) protein/Tfp pilus assembly protein PilF